ncbi:MAG: hypothetical protein M3O71_22120 [Bacteroidota bacterium]|nr:hypothetical protein [Bacteroidota bacterium]
MIIRTLVIICVFCFTASVFARGVNGHGVTHNYADTTIIKDSVKTVSVPNKRISKKPVTHSPMSQATRSRIAKIEALSKKIDKIEANIKRREAEIAKVEARQ